jgi:hypothetical protein
LQNIDVEVCSTYEQAANMAELGAVAAITQLAGLLLTCVNAVYSLIKQIKAAPKQIQHLVREISIIAEVLKAIPPKTITGREAIEKSLRHTTEVMEELHSTLTGLTSESKQMGLKAKFKLGSFVVFRQEEVQEMVERLRSAHSTLQFAVVCHCL